MFNRNINGKWSAEILILKRIAREIAKIHASTHNAARLDPLAAMRELEAFKVRIDSIRAMIANQQKVSYFDRRIPTVEQLARENLHEINKLMTRMSACRATAQKYLPDAQSYSEREMPHSSTWIQVKAKLSPLAHLCDIENTQHNALSKLLNPDDDVFVNSIEFGELALGEEIGFLALQRLREIANTSSNLSHKKIAKQTICHALDPNWPESLARVDMQELEDELTKLVYYAKSHSKNKVVWLGSARTVDAMIRHYPNQGHYLNCDDAKWSWALNRIWLQTAVKLGFEFRLVEQHFPGVEAALLSGDTSKLIEQLARQVRKDDKESTSQYNGEDAPTATAQEMLVLMEMGCTGRKDPNTGSIYLVPPAQAKDEQHIQMKTSSLGLKRQHSCPNFFKAGPPPRLNNIRDNFNDPGNSVELREQYNR